MRRIFLLVVWNGGGNVPPMLRIGERLSAAGHQVNVLGNPSLRRAVEGAGLRFLPFANGPDYDPAVPRSPAGDGRESRGNAGVQNARSSLFDAAGAVALDTAEAIAQLGPDLVAVDYVVMGGMVAAEAARLPFAVLVPHIYPLIHRGTAQRGVFSYMFDRVISGGLDTLNRLRREFGLDPLTAAREQYARAGVMLLTTYEAFDPPQPGILETVRYVGPQLSLPRQLLSDGDGAGELPLVVVSFSTAWQHQESFVRAVLAELSCLPVRVVFLTGPALAPLHFDAVENVTIRQFVPHHEVLPDAAALVCHGGHGSVMGGLCHGLPLVCAPFEQDQFDIANRVSQLGAGIHLSRQSPPQAIRRALEAAIGDPGLKAGARRVRARFLAEDDPGRAVRELESACETRAPASLP